MSDSDAGVLELKIERGSASDEELAAVTLVLCSVIAGRGAEEGDEGSPETPLWQPEKSSSSYRSPYSWR